jgi:hypothetical protein
MSRVKRGDALAWVAAAVSTILGAAFDARADDTDECLAASDAAQKERDTGRLVDAQRDFVTCSRPVCPRVVRTDCQNWLGEVTERMPSVIFVAHDAKGEDIADARVELDGKMIAPRLDGREVRIDPGAHKLRVTHAGDPPVEQAVVIREREKGRLLEVTFPTAPRTLDVAQTPGARRSGPPAAAYVLLGAGGVAMGSFAFFAISGVTDADNLRHSCAPYCPSSAVTDVRRRLAIADASLGVGLVALAVSGYLLLAPSGRATPTHAPTGTGGPSFDLAVVERGAIAGVSGRF